MLKRLASNYLQRHRNKANQLLHVFGVPLTFVVPAIFLVRQNPLLGASCFVGGYVLQFIGHAIEGNDTGELILVKKLLGRPYVEFGRRDSIGDR